MLLIMQKQLILFVLIFNSLKAWSYLDLNKSRGSQVITSSQNERCFIPQKFPAIDPQKIKNNYSENDLETELELCQVDTNIQQPLIRNTQSAYAVGLCPKLHNTNPGLELYEIPETTNKNDLEKMICDQTSTLRDASKLAKYKISTSCSYTPSILAYYHVSRILGGLLDVPPAVLKTLQAEEYKKTVLKGQKTLAKGGTIALTWKNLLKQLSSPTADKRGPYLFTTDSKQVYGTLLKNIKNEAAFAEISNDSGGEQIARAKDFMKEQVYLDLINSRQASQIISTDWNQANVQKLQLMADASDMLMIDYMLRQEDRFNNIAYKVEITGIANNEIKTVQSKKADDLEKITKTQEKFKELYPNANAFPVKRIILKDNDCGVAVENGVARTSIVAELKMLDPLKHIKKSTYDQIQRFAGVMNSSNTAQFTKDFFMNETTMTANDYTRFQNNTKTLAETIKLKCQKGLLFLDLDLDQHFIAKAVHSLSLCDVK